MVLSEKIPVHVGVIMDGNGRWAQLRRLPRIEGHRVGAERAKEIIGIAGELGIKCLTLYTFSADIMKQLDIVRRSVASVPVIALRAYMSLAQEINTSIEALSDVVFYKPVDGELITQAIEDLLQSKYKK